MAKLLELGLNEAKKEWARKDRDDAREKRKNTSQESTCKWVSN